MNDIIFVHYNFISISLPSYLLVLLAQNFRFSVSIFGCGCNMFPFLYIAMVDALTSKTVAWEKENGVGFTYDGVSSLSTRPSKSRSECLDFFFLLIITVF